jgi:hypothetical protein
MQIDELEFCKQMGLENSAVGNNHRQFHLPSLSKRNYILRVMGYLQSTLQCPLFNWGTAES